MGGWRWRVKREETNQESRNVPSPGNLEGKYRANNFCPRWVLKHKSKYYWKAARVWRGTMGHETSSRQAGLVLSDSIGGGWLGSYIFGVQIVLL